MAAPCPLLTVSFSCCHTTVKAKPSRTLQSRHKVIFLMKDVSRRRIICNCFSVTLCLYYTVDYRVKKHLTLSVQTAGLAFVHSCPLLTTSFHTCQTTVDQSNSKPIPPSKLVWIMKMTDWLKDLLTDVCDKKCQIKLKYTYDYIV